MAPPATQWASFEKDRGAYAGAILSRKPLQMKYHGTQVFFSICQHLVFRSQHLIKNGNTVGFH
jgi:hypothetical protein